MFRKVYDILVDFLGESKQGDYSSDNMQYSFNCPCCAEDNGGFPDGKHNLEVRLDPKKLVFQCWKCGDTDGMKGPVGYLIRRYGGKLRYQRYKEEIINLRKQSLYTFDNWDSEDLIKLETFVKLPKTYSKINLNMPLDKRLIEYLSKRKIDQKLIDKYNIGYTGWEDDTPRWGHRIIIPSYDSFGDVNYWLGRDYTGKQMAKYCNCDADKKSIIFQESKIDWDAPIYLVEGGLDCLYYPNAVALLGKSLSKDSYLFKSLLTRANSDVVICLDGDTDFGYETCRIGRELNRGRLKGKLYYINLSESKYKDFGEAYESGGPKEIVNLIKEKKKFKEIEL